MVYVHTKPNELRIFGTVVLVHIPKPKIGWVGIWVQGHEFFTQYNFNTAHLPEGFRQPTGPRLSIHLFVDEVDRPTRLYIAGQTIWHRGEGASDYVGVITPGPVYISRATQTDSGSSRWGIAQKRERPIKNPNFI